MGWPSSCLNPLQIGSSVKYNVAVSGNDQIISDLIVSIPFKSGHRWNTTEFIKIFASIEVSIPFKSGHRWNSYDTVEYIGTFASSQSPSNRVIGEIPSKYYEELEKIPVSIPFKSGHRWNNGYETVEHIGVFACLNPLQIGSSVK